jgi:hypothetical protein
MKKIYLSGPITGVPDYRARFSRAASVVRGLLSHAEILNPAEAQERPGWSWADWMLYDLILLRGASCAVFLPGWKGSPGARVEREFASGLGIPIVELTELDLVHPGRSLAVALHSVAEAAR